MGIFDRLEDLIKSYINDEDTRIFGKNGGRPPSGDPDVDAAFEELNEFLSGGGTSGGGAFRGAGRGAWGERRFPGGAWQESPGAERGPRAGGAAAGLIPEEIRRDFAELGLEPGAPEEACKAAYKKLLKLHHPDRHAGRPENMKKATEKSARINAAYDRIEGWRRSR
jgi:hypothetical protein